MTFEPFERLIDSIACLTRKQHDINLRPNAKIAATPQNGRRISKIPLRVRSFAHCQELLWAGALQPEVDNPEAGFGQKRKKIDIECVNARLTSPLYLK